MFRKIVVIGVLIFCICTGDVIARQDIADKWDKTVAIRELPYCALILRAFLGSDDSSRKVFVLMEPDNINEENLRLLAKTMSDRYPPPLFLEVHVTTDVKQLATLVTNSNISGSGNYEAPGKKELQWAYYRRSEEVELFRYNPEFPKPGMKTVILKGAGIAVCFSRGLGWTRNSDFNTKT
jgi:hypothetical protein